MRPPSVYEVVTPSSHKTRSTTRSVVILGSVLSHHHEYDDSASDLAMSVLHCTSQTSQLCHAHRHEQPR